MNDTWIVGIDGSPDACAALSWTTEFVAAVGSGAIVPVTAWHVPLPITALAGRRPIEVDRMGLQAEAELLVASTVDEVDDPKAMIGPAEVVEGHPAPVLLGRSGPDSVVVVGRRGISDFKHRLLGSVSQYVATHASGPVVVVPSTWSGRPCRTIVVGFDGSDHAIAALRWALEVAPADAEVTALMAIDVIPWLRPELVEQRYPAEVAAAEERIRAAIDDVDPEQKVRREVVLHGARQALTEASGEADLVVVGPRGIGGVARAVLGSVTTWLLHDAPCPVAVVPSPE